MKTTMRLLSIILGLGGIGMLFLAGAVHLNILWTIGLVMLGVAAVVALVSAFIEGNGGDNIGSYRMPLI